METLGKGSMINYWNAIRRAYEIEGPRICAGHVRRGPMYRHDPYFFIWRFTKIEDNVWHDIRYYGVPLYPQVPAAEYLIDFANPYYKVGIEADGKEWHDKEKDTERDKYLFKLGWKIFRVPGSKTYFEYVSREDDENDSDFLRKIKNTSEGVVYAINNVYFNGNLEERDQCVDILNRHNLVGFDTEWEAI